MEKEVLIRVKGLHITDAAGEDEPIELVLPGEYYFRNGSHYLRYEERMEGFVQPTVNFVKFSRNGMEVRKKGVINAHMVFQQGKRNATLYATPFGTIEMGISATSIELTETGESISMKASYILDTGDTQVSDCCLDIQAQTKSSKKFVL